MKKTIKEQKLVLIILLSNLFIAYLGSCYPSIYVWKNGRYTW
jgi:hypothetical protein